MKKTFFFIFFCFLAAFSLAQSRSFFSSVKAWAIAHPFAGRKLKTIDKHCDSIYKTVKHRAELDIYSSGGKLDAFRHVFYFAAFAQKISVRKLRKLGIAYENENYKQFLAGESSIGERHDSLSMVMDLHNNELAFSCAENFKDLDLFALRDSVIKLISDGKALIFYRNKTGNYLDCQGKLLNLTEYKDLWFVPKCLVRSDLVYRD